MKFQLCISRRLALGSALACWAFAPLACRADDAPEAKAAEAADADKKDRFAIPEGDADELQNFMHKLGQSEPEGETEEEQMAYTKKMLNTFVEAADRLLNAEPTELQAAEAYQFKVMAFSTLPQLGDDKAAEKLAKVIDAARADKREMVVVVGWKAFIENNLSQWKSADDKAKQAFMEEVLARVNAKGGPKAIDASIVGAVAGALDGVDDEFAAKLLTVAMPVLDKSDDEGVKQVVEENNLQGVLRRLNLMGQPMEITGKLLDGKELDWKSYRGKVVLVDFWAGWCGPCRGEIPNILKLYEAYHDKGFDVLGISLDLSKKDAERAIREDGIPWPSIFQEPNKDEGDPRFSNSLVKYYGITGIPKAILVDKEGKVVHMEARGEELGKELQRLLGDPLVPLDQDAEGAEVEKSDLETALEK